MNQPTFSASEGKDRRTWGQRQVEENSGGFVGHLRQFAVRWASNYGTVTSDVLRHYATEQHITPHHPNCWGAIFRGNMWEHVGFKQSELVSNHARWIRVWRVRGGAS